MLWFKDRKRMEFIQSYIPTSKAQLIQVAMWYHKGDMQKAQEMVDFYNKNMNLPDFDPVQPTWMDQMKNGATDFFSFIRNNQSDIVNGYEFIRSIITNKGALPSIGEEAADVAATEVSAEEALPKIN